MAQITTVKKVSSFLTLGKQDLLKGMATTIITAVLTALYKMFDEGTFDLTTKSLSTIGMVAVAAGISYLLKNLFSGPKFGGDTIVE